MRHKLIGSKPASSRPHPFAAPATIAAVALALLGAWAWVMPGLAAAGITHQFTGHEITEVNGVGGTQELREVTL